MLTKFLNPWLSTNCAITPGIVKRLDANITGTTPAVFILIGIYDLLPPIAIVDLFAYCIGTLLSASCMYITPITTAKYTITKAIKISVPISVLKLPDNTNSSKAVTNIDGSVDIIPAIIISDTPFPIPFWVI